MNSLPEAIARLPEWWGAWMIAMSWQVTVIVLVVWFATRFSRFSPARLRHLLWLLVFVKLVLPPGLSTPWSVGNLVPNGVATPAPLQAVQRVDSSGEQISSGNVDDAVVATPAIPPATRNGAFPANAAWLMGGWACVSAVLLSTMFFQYYRFSRKLLRGATMASSALQGIVSRERERLGVRQNVVCMVSPSVDLPAVFGIATPVILLPKHFETDFAEDDIAAIAGHELAHIQRGDLISGVFAAVLSCLYWFHPAVWIANLYHRREREMACDDMVLDARADAGARYAATLLKAAEHFRRPVPIAAGFLGVLEVADDLLRRIVSATDNTRVRRLGWGSVAVLMMMTLLLPMGAWPAFGDESSERAALQPPDIASITPAIGAKDVEPATTEIRVTFDQDMLTGGHSWTGSGEAFPKTTGNAKWVDKRTCALPVALEPGKFYRLGVNSTGYQNFRGATKVPARIRTICFVTKGASASELAKLEPPNVVALTPAADAKDVPTNVPALTVTFDKPMGDGFSWVTLDNRFPPTAGKPVWSENNTVCTLPVKLEAGTSYRLGLNGGDFVNFESAAGIPLEPVVWSFQTAK